MTTATPRLVVIRPAGSWARVDVRELWEFRDLFLTLAARDLKVRYRQTALGVIWVVAQPLMASLIFAVVFGRVARLPSAGIPYLIFAYAGFLAWNLFNGVVTRAASCLAGNVHLISKVYFPRLVLPLSSTVAVLVDFTVALAVMAVLLVLYHMPVRVTLLLLPAGVGLVLLLAVGVGLSAAALSVRFRDVGHVLPVGLQLLMYASPVAYAVELVPPSLRPFFLLNPLSGALEAFRWSILGTSRPHAFLLVWSALASVACFLAGLVLFRRAERNIVDVI